MNDTLINKAFATNVELEDRTFIATISTETLDRDGDIMLMSGVKLDNYRQAPRVLWQHDHNIPPIGKAEWIKTDGNKLVAKAKFASTPLAEDIYQLVKGGFLNTLSVGFSGSYRDPNDNEKAAQPGVQRVFDNWELMEFSVVNVPANPTALIEAIKTKSITLSEDFTQFLPVVAVSPVVEEVKDMVVELAFSVAALETPVMVKRYIPIVSVKTLAQWEAEKQAETKVIVTKILNKQRGRLV